MIKNASYLGKKKPTKYTSSIIEVICVYNKEFCLVWNSNIAVWMEMFVSLMLVFIRNSAHREEI